VNVGRHSYVTGDAHATTRVTVGNFTSIGPGVQMHGRIQHPCIAHPALVSTSTGKHIPGYPPVTVRDGIAIGSDVWIGQNAVLLGGITIGHGAIVGAYAVVAKDVPPYAVVVGNPAHVKRHRFDPETVAALLTVQWWDWPDDVIAERAADLRDVRTLVAKYAYGIGG
jgi:acetyltransferase-like isoleucine patch superfamily enzyme